MSFTSFNPSVWPLPSASKLAGARVVSLGSLASMTLPELDALYQAGRAPKLSDLKGNLDGRYLSMDALRGVPNLEGTVDFLASTLMLFWKGKTYTPNADGKTGTGYNRIFNDSFQMAHFETSMGKSRAGNFQALQMSYDVDGNLPGIRNIRDEVREVAPGVYLGQAYLTLGGKDTFLFYFGLEAPSQ
jgi:hypothetical protein